MASNPDTRPLPEGWVQQFNESYKAWFYVNKNASGGPASQWTHPADDAPKTESFAPPAGAPPPPSSTANNATPINTNTSSYNNYDEKSSTPVNEYRESPTSPYGQNNYGQSGNYGQSNNYEQDQHNQQQFNQQQSQPKKKGLGGFLQGLKEKASQPRPGGGYPGGGGYVQQGYPQQGYGGYPQQGGYGGYPQQGYPGGPMMGRPMYVQGRPQRGGMGAGGAAALGVGGGLLGGMMIGNMMADNENDAYAEGYEDGAGGDDFGGDF